MTSQVIDWKRATRVGSILGGVFWGLAAGTLLVSHASGIAVTGICFAAAGLVLVGLFVYRTSDSSRGRSIGISLMLAPCTGIAPLALVWLPGLLVHAIPWKG